MVFQEVAICVQKENYQTYVCMGECWKSVGFLINQFEFNLKFIKPEKKLV